MKVCHILAADNFLMQGRRSPGEGGGRPRGPGRSNFLTANFNSLTEEFTVLKT